MLKSNFNVLDYRRVSIVDFEKHFEHENLLTERDEGIYK